MGVQYNRAGSQVSNIQLNVVKIPTSDITGSKSTKNDLQGMANTLCDGSRAELAEIINVAFAAVSDDMVPLNPNDKFTLSHSPSPMPDRYIISVTQVEKSLARINARKAIGPDSIPNWLLQNLAPYLAPPICAIWNSSLRESFIPEVWKSGDVIPLPKVNPPMRIDKDLRPISLTPVLSKSLEWFIRDWIMDIVNDLLDPHQYGSRKGCSTTIAIVELVHEWLNAAEKPDTCVRILLLDFRKAFDRVDHTILLTKLANTGVPDFLLQWVTSFLCERKQCVRLGDETSSWCHLKAGVPQGTLLGTTGFLLHINDLKTLCHHIKYVDDSTIWESCNRTGHDSVIQTAADQASEWTNKNLMQTNTDKTKEMCIYFGKKDSTLTAITMDGTEIKMVSHTKLLGVMINNKLNWADHVDYISKKAGQRIYFLCLLKRAGKTPGDIVAVYTSLIRPVLEYACEAWHPGLTKKQSNTIEHLQMRALNIAYPEMSYEATLEKSGLIHLEQRRKDHCKQFFIDITKPTHKLNHLLPKKKEQSNFLRKSIPYELPKVRTNRLKNSPINYGLFNCQDCL